MVTGASGVGKTSLGRAGVVPALKRSGEPWEILFLRPGREPLGAWAALLSPMLGLSETMTTVEDDLESQAELVKMIREEPGFPGRALRSVAKRTQTRILVWVDQGEEIFTLCSPEDRSAFLATLPGIADDPSSPLRLLVTIRSDFLQRLAEAERKITPDLGPALFFLAPPDASQLREAIEGPAKIARYQFEHGVVDHMIEHLRATPAAFALLQFGLRGWWETRDPERRLFTKESYFASGGASGALARHADAVIEGLAPQLQSAARDMLLRLVTPARTGAVLPLEELHALPGGPELVEQLVRARILLIEKSSRGNTVELVHDSLIEAWPTLRKLLATAARTSNSSTRLGTTARLWAGNNRDRELLWRGAEMLADARHFQKHYRGHALGNGRGLPERVLRPGSQDGPAQAPVLRRGRRIPRSRGGWGGWRVRADRLFEE